MIEYTSRVDGVRRDARWSVVALSKTQSIDIPGQGVIKATAVLDET